MLKWKLLNALQKKNSNPSTQCLWSQQSYTLRDIVNNFKLPCLVLCTTECSVQWNAFHFDLKQPLLLHSTRKVQKATARCLRRVGPLGQYEGLGTNVVIPDDYCGWFTLIEGNNNGAVPYGSIREVAESDVDDFLVLKAVIGKSLKGERRVISNAEVLHKTERKNSQTFLWCKDDKDEELGVSFLHQGQFYKVSEDPECENCIFKISDIIKIKDMRLPIYMRHVVGEIPMLTSAYSSLLELVAVKEEETILASTLNERTMMPLELQMSSPIKFQISLNESSLRHTNQYCEAFQYCQTDGEEYVRAMKVAFNMSPEFLLESNSTLYSSTDTLAGKSENSLNDINTDYFNEEDTISLDKVDLNSLDETGLLHKVDDDAARETDENLSDKPYKISLNETEVTSMNDKDIYSLNDIDTESLDEACTYPVNTENTNFLQATDTNSFIADDTDSLIDTHSKSDNPEDSKLPKETDSYSLNEAESKSLDADDSNSLDEKDTTSISESDNYFLNEVVTEDLEDESYYSDSEFGDVDATAEFTFKWTYDENNGNCDKMKSCSLNAKNQNNSKEDLYVPKVFNSCINSAKSSRESVVWNEQPDFV